MAPADHPTPPGPPLRPRPAAGGPPQGGPDRTVPARPTLPHVSQPPPVPRSDPDARRRAAVRPPRPARPARQPSPRASWAPPSAAARRRRAAGADAPLSAQKGNAPRWYTVQRPTEGVPHDGDREQTALDRWGGGAIAALP